MGERTTSKFEVALFMWQGTDGLKGAITYKTELFNASTIQTMIERFVLLLKNIVSQLDKPINTFDISTEEEKTQKLEEKRRKTSARIDKLKMKKSEEIYSAMKNDLLL